ncbi:MAG TPA: hypothetical protein VHS09_06985 [Polyangiaceae bacterium]|nr:hypothetical protein [Polyangiaceae bacterium]
MGVWAESFQPQRTRGAPAGLVQLARWKSVKVRPAIPAGEGEA